MTELRLAKLPDRTPIKLTIMVMPELNQLLQDYAELYAKAYEREETIADLIPAMLVAFLDSDRAFQKSRGTRHG